MGVREAEFPPLRAGTAGQPARLHRSEAGMSGGDPWTRGTARLYTAPRRLSSPRDKGTTEATGSTLSP